MSDVNHDLPLPSEDGQPVPEDPAVSLIRHKLDSLYEKEPAAKAEEQEIEAVGATSKHQRFIDNLMNSSRSLTDVQQAWHDYYQQLSDDEKHVVWQEFYANHERQSKYFASLAKPAAAVSGLQTVKLPPKPDKQLIGRFEPETETVSPEEAAKTKDKLIRSVKARGKVKARHHLLSLLFGLSFGLLVIFIFMFGFFNERFIQPFITPSRTIAETSVIPDAVSGASVGPAPEIIIPEINIGAPVVYDVTDTGSSAILSGLERGVVHYGASAYPGENGNVVIFGHSAENFFNHGHYKYVFSLLHDLKVGDTFMLNYYGQQYVYQIYDKEVIAPTDVAVLGPNAKPATVTLITCDPPGVSVHRLIIVAEQISPSPSGNTAGPVINSAQQPKTIINNTENLWQRLSGWL